jgi:uncharacterized membrane protein SpoIIM required for sporulation
VDLDLFIRLNEPTWRRLELLSGIARRSPGSLSQEELDEFVQLYQRTSSHLTRAQTSYRDPALTARLTSAVAGAAGTLYGSKDRTKRSFGAFFTHTFPAAVHYNRRFLALSAVLFLVPMFVMGAWMANDEESRNAVKTEVQQDDLVDGGFEDYYSASNSDAYLSTATLKNFWVGTQAFALGITGIGAARVLVLHGVDIGYTLGAFASDGEQPAFWGVLLPHGALELSAIFIAAAAGLRLSWTIFVPGDRSRLRAFAEEGRRAGVVVLGVFLVFLVAAAIEAFLSRTVSGTPIRIVIGLTAELALVTYLVTRGREAAALGLTGRFGERVPTPGEIEERRVAEADRRKQLSAELVTVD